MIATSGISGLLESLYATEPDTTSWLEGIYEAAGEAFEGVGEIQVTAARTPKGQLEFEAMVGNPDLNAHSARLLPLMDPAAAVRFFYSGPVTSGRRLMLTSQSSNAAQARELHSLFDFGCRKFGYLDAIGVVGMDTDGHVITLALGTTGTQLPRRTRATLVRLAGQLTTAYRLRRRRSAPVAEVQPSGSVDVVSGLDGGAASSLRQAALAFDRARRMAPQDPDRALAHWKAMVDGQWTLVERVEAGGRRVFVAHENEPSVRASRALTPGERKVVGLAALGHPLKLVAYELGYAESTTSQLLKGALQKLGLRSRVELLQMARAFHPDASDDPVDLAGSRPARALPA